MMKIFLILFLCSINLNANEIVKSTFTPIIPLPMPKETIDWQDIMKLSTNTFTALDLALSNTNYSYLKEEIEKRQEVILKNEVRVIKNKKLGRGYFGYIKK